MATQALLHGVPVIYQAPHYFLALAAGHDLAEWNNPRKPDRQPAFECFAWAQWSMSEIARDNLSRFRGPPLRCEHVEIVEGDVRTYEYPAGNLLVYLYSPFSTAITNRVVASLSKTGRKRSKFILVYCGLSPTDESFVPRQLESNGFEIYLRRGALDKESAWLAARPRV